MILSSQGYRYLLALPLLLRSFMYYPLPVPVRLGWEKYNIKILYLHWLHLPTAITTFTVDKRGNYTGRYLGSFFPSFKARENVFNKNESWPHGVTTWGRLASQRKLFSTECFLTELGSQDIRGVVNKHLAPAWDLSYLLWHPVIAGMTIPISGYVSLWRTEFEESNRWSGHF